ncbi:MAG: RNA polymerase subunit sigma [Proteobacteria bacterium]|nr:RNA polymerase subunit sigma [Pseudomonadota bacterium]
MNDQVEKAIRSCVQKDGRLVVLTGAGISAESGVPTFRGPDGYWTVGSKEYRPEEMATFAMFSQNPDEIWQWYLYRIDICRNAEPNAGHKAVVEMEKILGDRFVLITQNVDGLHLRAGNSTARTYQIHGNIETTRCGRSCSRQTYPLPESLRPKEKDEPLTKSDRQALECPSCGSRLRPHVLWFDESYDEEYYRFNSSIQAAIEADMLITIGTSGATNLPMQVGMIVSGRGGIIVDVNPDHNPFSAIAQQSGGFFCQGSAGEILPEFAEVLTDEKDR